MSEETKDTLEVGDLTHIERPSLPWRRENKTECGLDASRHPTWTRDEAEAVEKKIGKIRFSMHVCMTCKPTVGRHASWDEDPAACLIRHAEKMSHSRWGYIKQPSDVQRRFADELRAIAALVEAHREEFDALVESYGDVVDLAERRRAGGKP